MPSKTLHNNAIIYELWHDGSPDLSAQAVTLSGNINIGRLG